MTPRYALVTPEGIRAALQMKYEGGNDYDVRREAIQTAAMCIRLLKNMKP